MILGTIHACISIVWPSIGIVVGYVAIPAWLAPRLSSARCLDQLYEKKAPGATIISSVHRTAQSYEVGGCIAAIFSDLATVVACAVPHQCVAARATTC